MESMAKVKVETEAQMQKRWQAESDARALQRVAEIQADASRKRAAEAQIKKELKELQKTQAQMQSLVSKSTPKSGRGRK
jgi:hypothetical protein